MTGENLKFVKYYFNAKYGVPATPFLWQTRGRIMMIERVDENSIVIYYTEPIEEAKTELEKAVEKKEARAP